MKRLCHRFLLVGSSLATLVASIVFLLGQSQTMFASLRTPIVGCTIRADDEGLVFQTAIPGSAFDWGCSKSDGQTVGTWASQMEDLNPTWITNAVVWSGWEVNQTRFVLIGFKHYAVILILAITTVLIGLWFRRRWPAGHADET